MDHSIDKDIVHSQSIISIVLQGRTAIMDTVAQSNVVWESILQGLADLKNCQSAALGGNVILCSGTTRLSMHESLLRTFTVIFDGLPERALSELMDENDTLTVIIPSLSSQTMTALKEFL